MTTSKILNQKWKISWQVLSLVLALSFGGVGFMATKALLGLPSEYSCNRLSLWFTSATNRMYCAQLKAERNTVDDLLEAIAILEELSDTHPLHHEVTRYIDDWSNDILYLAEVDLNRGELDEAIAIARKIPQNESNKEIIENKIARWQKTWEQGNEVEAEVEAELRESQWNKAFLVAVKLLNFNSDYWSKVRYQQIVNNINLAREESKKLDGAYTSIREGGLKNYLKTLEIAGQIPASSYSYNQAQKLITKAEDELEKIAAQLLKSNDWDQLSELSSNIPAKSRLYNSSIDWKTLANAAQNVELSTISGIELAIAEAEQISSESEIYAQTQDLIRNWSDQKEDLAYLSSARNIASSGDVGDLNSAIAKAQLIKNGTSVYSEAQQEIRNWRREIQVIEDRPLLNQAEQLALSNTIQGWRSAINQASRINSNRALHSEARELIRQWNNKIETAEDRPVLQRAISLGNSSRYQEAINVASGIGRGRSLYGEAQTNIRKWRTEINAQKDLNFAYNVANSGDAQALSRAINIARRIPLKSSVGFQSRQAIDLWSEQILGIAQRTGDSYSIPDVEKAIGIAEMIPRGNSAYNRAQAKIQQWKKIIYPSLNDISSGPTVVQEADFAQ